MTQDSFIDIKFMRTQGLTHIKLCFLRNSMTNNPFIVFQFFTTFETFSVCQIIQV